MMIQTETIISLGFILSAFLSLVCFSISKRGRSSKGFRDIQPIKKLRHAAGLSVEAGKRIHVSIGSSSILGPNNASALVGLASLEQTARTGLVSDRPPVATSGDGALSILCQDTLQAEYRANLTPGQYNPDQGRMAGTTPFSYLAGIITLQKPEQVSVNLLVGHFGPEAALVSEEADRQNAFILAASESLPAQAAFYVASDDVLIGEDLFALPAYMQDESSRYAGLRAQDLLRWVLIAVLVVGSILKLVETFLGGPLL